MTATIERFPSLEMAKPTEPAAMPIAIAVAVAAKGYSSEWNPCDIA